LTFFPFWGNISPGRARWGASGALYLKSAYAGSNSPSEGWRSLGLPGLSGVEDWVLRGRSP